MIKFLFNLIILFSISLNVFADNNTVLRKGGNNSRIVRASKIQNSDLKRNIKSFTHSGKTRNVINKSSRVNRASINRSANLGIMTRKYNNRNYNSINSNKNNNHNISRSGRRIRGAILTKGTSRYFSPRTALNTKIIKTNYNSARTARATALFDDISKIGGGYAKCREAYNSCMDEICGKASDTFRRCYCSDKFQEFLEIDTSLNEATILIKKFEDNNLKSVDKTADEVEAMYSATSGEKAITNDTSAAAGLLAEIGDLLNGTKKKKDNLNKSISIDFSADIDDVWGNKSSDFANKNGSELFKSADSQCLELSKDVCSNPSVTTMAKSSYSILIGQDCNSYEKKINKKREEISKTVRKAEKILREARLNEYRSHNSADVNECITKVANKIKEDSVCGSDYRKCLDYTGKYIDFTTGNALYTPHLFELRELIKLDFKGTSDILTANTEFNKFLDDKRIFVDGKNGPLDSCRDNAETVWTEFKKTALIEIAQAQDAKIEEVKNSCVSTMAECYDKQTGALKKFSEQADSGGALSRYTAKSMCEEKVISCASLYSKPGEPKCDFENGILKKPCGLTALLNFVNTVDTVIVSKECFKDVSKYAEELCQITINTEQILPKSRIDTSGGGERISSEKNTVSTSNISPCQKMFRIDVEKLIKDKSILLCLDPSKQKEEIKNSTDSDTQSDKNKQKYTNPNYNLIEAEVKKKIDEIIRNIEIQMSTILSKNCYSLGGFWIPTGTEIKDRKKQEIKQKFLTDNFDSVENLSWGRCVENTAAIRCDEIINANTSEPGQESKIKYNEAKESCDLSQEWFEIKCSELGKGYYDNTTNTCYIVP